MNFIFPYIGNVRCHNPNWRTHIFQRGRSTTNQSRLGGGSHTPGFRWSLRNEAPSWNFGHARCRNIAGLPFPPPAMWWSSKDGWGNPEVQATRTFTGGFSLVQMEGFWLGLPHCCLVVYHIAGIFPYIGNNHPKWKVSDSSTLEYHGDIMLIFFHGY